MYLRLLMFLLPIWIPACNSYNPAFLMICSAHQLNKRDDSRQLRCTPFSIVNQSVVPNRALTVTSWPAYRFLSRQIRCSGIPISLRIFHRLSWSTWSKAFSVVDETEIDVFLKCPCFLNNPVNVGNLISRFSSFSKPSLDIWKFLFHVMLKPSMQDFKHDLTSMGDECNCLIACSLVLPFLGTWCKEGRTPNN